MTKPFLTEWYTNRLDVPRRGAYSVLNGTKPVFFNKEPDRATETRGQGCRGDGCVEGNRRCDRVATRGGRRRRRGELLLEQGRSRAGGCRHHGQRRKGDRCSGKRRQANRHPAAVRGDQEGV